MSNLIGLITFKHGSAFNHHIIKAIRLISTLTHCILADSSTIICWTSTFVILGVLGSILFFLMENPVRKQCSRLLHYYMLDKYICHFRGVGFYSFF